MKGPPIVAHTPAVADGPAASPEFLDAIAALGRNVVVSHALASQSGPAEASQRRMLTFELAGEEYALDILRIREIVRMRPITEVPRAVPFLAGILSLRGTVLPVLDLRLRMRLPAAPRDAATRILIVHRERELFGLIVDGVRHVVRLRQEEIEPPPQGLLAGEADLLAGIGRPHGAHRLLILVDLDSVLTFDASLPGGAG